MYQCDKPIRFYDEQPKQYAYDGKSYYASDEQTYYVILWNTGTFLEYPITINCSLSKPLIKDHLMLQYPTVDMVSISISMWDHKYLYIFHSSDFGKQNGGNPSSGGEDRMQEMWLPRLKFSIPSYTYCISYWTSDWSFPPPIGHFTFECRNFVKLDQQKELVLDISSCSSDSEDEADTPIAVS